MMLPLIFLFALTGLSAAQSGFGNLSTCTLVVDSVITSSGSPSISDSTASFSDRCVHNVLSAPGFRVLAHYRERRRKDVSFLDSLTLERGSDKLQMGQGGNVRLNGTVLSLNSSVQTFGGFELSKDQTGVTVVWSKSSDYFVSLFFDGNMAQFHYGGNIDGGKCFDTGLDSKVTELSPTGCGDSVTQSPETGINMTLQSARCGLMDDPLFNVCGSSYFYQSACSGVLGVYPMVDGLDCLFHEAYARACSLKNITVEGWRSKLNCPAPVACQSKECGDQAFCGDTVTGGTGCLCRAIFADPYRQTSGTLGDPTVCSQDSASVSLVACLLAEKGIDYSMLHLKNKNCTGQMDEGTGKVTFSFNSTNTCGTEILTNSSQITYKNSIVSANTSDIIVRHDQFQLDFSCYYTQPEAKTVGFRIRDSSVVLEIVSDAWNYTLTMKAFTDAGRTLALNSSTEVSLDQKIFVELATTGLEGGSVAVVTDSCWATSEAAPNATQKYDLIKNGCPNTKDKTVMVMGNGAGTSNYFSFNMFQFSGGSTDVYLHCKLNLCATQNNTCAPTCGSRRRRSAKSTQEQAALISMSWTN